MKTKGVAELRELAKLPSKAHHSTRTIISEWLNARMGFYKGALKRQLIHECNLTEDDLDELDYFYRTNDARSYKVWLDEHIHPHPTDD